MGVVNLKPNEILRRKGDIIENIDIVLKGALVADDVDEAIILDSGSILGLGDRPGNKYVYTFKAKTDTTVASYPYSSTDDIINIIENNPKISPLLTSQCIKLVNLSLRHLESEYEELEEEYNHTLEDWQEYPMLAASVGVEARSFPKLNYLHPIDKISPLPKWQENYYHTLYENEELLRKYVYSISTDIAIGSIVYANGALAQISECRRKIEEYKEEMKLITSGFKSELVLIRARADEMKRNGTDGEMTDIDIRDALTTIVHYSDVDEKLKDSFTDAINTFKKDTMRYDNSDDSRALRRSVSQYFYEIYLAVFLKSLSDPNPPDEVKMFLMFGFVDEEMAGLENTRQLYILCKNYTPDYSGHVFTAYEWLKKIYYMDKEPSRNEFDEDYFTALRTLKSNGDITEEEMNRMKDNPDERLKFEFKNLFNLGNRMTFGRPSVFVPVFDSANCTRPLDKSYVDYNQILGFYEEIKKIDYSVFCRQGIYSNPGIGVNQVFLNEDVTPIMILMPNMGSRASLWQEIEGKKRNTPGRLIMSVFHTEEFNDTMIKLCGEFRWEMCKTEQGVHWNDVTDPSLTSMYCDYLQFYKKNHVLSADGKEKLKTQLQKFSNNYKNVFISDYIQYIKFEANASLRLNKVAREILFTFCPFSAELRDKMSDNPQYTDLIKKHDVHMESLMRPLSNIMVKISNEGIEIPDVLSGQYEFYKK